METLAVQNINAPSKGALWTGRIISGLVILFLLFDSIAKVFRESHHVEGTAKFGFADSFVQPLGVLLLLLTILYIVPRTAVVGLLLLTAYFGGAVAVMIQHGENFAFPIVFCMLAWTGLLLQYPSLRGFLQLKRH